MDKDKETKQAWKLIMSSLFARAMPYVVTGFGEDKWLFTNVLPEQMRDRTLDSDSCLQFVHFKDCNDQKLIVKAFPILGKAAIILNIRKTSGEINKFGIEKCSLVLENQRVYLKVAGRDDHAQLNDSMICGKLLSQYEMNYYLGYYDRFITRKTLDKFTAVLSKIEESELDAPKSAVNTVKIRSLIPGGDGKYGWFRLPLMDGYNFPSLFEYTRKSGITDYILNADIIWRNRSAEVVVCYDDPFISVRSVNPRRLWYPIAE